MQTHHISLLTKDAAQNIAFYTKTLGLRLVKNTVNQENIHIRHLFYGDYLGTPGSVITFFVLPLLGRRTDGNHYINGFSLAIPTGSSAFWIDRLKTAGFDPEATDTGLKFLDPDLIPVTMVETEETLTEWQINPNNGISVDHQITHFLGTELHVPDVAATKTFFEKLIGADVSNDTVHLDRHAAIKIFPTTNFEQVTRFGRGRLTMLPCVSMTKRPCWPCTKRLRSRVGTLKCIAIAGGLRASTSANQGITVSSSLPRPQALVLMNRFYP